MMRFPVRRKCSICKAPMDAELISSDPPENPWWAFRKTLPVFRCPNCDCAPDPDSRDVHKQITDGRGTMGA